MEGSARDRGVLGLSLFLSIAPGLAAIGGCVEGDPQAPLAPPTVKVTAPVGFVQLLPTRTVDIECTVDLAGGDPSASHLAVQLVHDLGGRDAPIFDGPAPPSGDPARLPLPAPGQPYPVPGIYHVAATVEASGGTVTAPPTASRVAVQGVIFTQPASGETVEASKATPATLELDTITLGTMGVTLELTPVAGGTPIAIRQATVPGEVRPIGRSYIFAGSDAANTPIPAGEYRLAAVATDVETGIAARTDGGVVRVAP